MNLKVRHIQLDVTQKIMSVYWGFFSGGARNVHTDIIRRMHKEGRNQCVVSYYTTLDRGSEGIQHMEDDKNYKLLAGLGIKMRNLGLTPKDKIDLYNEVDPFGEQANNAETEEQAKKLARIIAKEKPSVILCLKEQPLNLIIMANRYLKYSLGHAPVPIIVTLHRTDPGLQDPKSFERLKEIEKNPRTKKYVTGYIGCSESSALAYAQSLDLPNEVGTRFVFVSNGIDLGSFNTKEPKKIKKFLKKYFANTECPPEASSPIITLAARNSEEKNISLFVESAIKFLMQNEKAHVVMCGSGMEPEMVKPLIRSSLEILGIRKQDAEEALKRLHPIGRLSRKAITKLLSISNICSLTSPTLGEADPLTLKEGLASGCIPVTTNTGDTPQIVGAPNPRRLFFKDIADNIIGKRGILTPQDSDKIIEAWEYALSNPHKFAPNIHAFRNELDVSHMVNGYLEKIDYLTSLTPELTVEHDLSRGYI